MKGIRQADKGGRELIKLCGGVGAFDGKFCSPFIRSIETALGLSGRENYEWQINNYLIERLWGSYGAVNYFDRSKSFPATFERLSIDPFYTRFNNGESPFDAMIRFEYFYNHELINRGLKNVIIISHKQTIQAACYFIEKQSPAIWDDWRGAFYIFPNLGMVEYSRVNPYNSEDIRNDYTWRRIVDLASRGKSQVDESWQEISPRDTFMPMELRDMVEQFPKFEKLVDKRKRI